MDTKETTKNDDKISDEETLHITDTARGALDKSVDALPHSIKERLAEARAQALHQHRQSQAAQSQSNQPSVNSYLFLGLAASMFIVSFLWFYQSGNVAGTSPPELAHIESEAVDSRRVLAESHRADSVDGLLVAMQMAQLDSDSAAIVEDLEFIYWLSIENETGV